MKVLFLACGLLAGSSLMAQTVQFYGTPTSAISSGAVVPAGKKLLWTSGVTASAADTTAKVGTPTRYGDTKTQSVDILKKFEKALKDHGLTFKDVLMLRVYVAPDKYNGNKHDYQGWFDAYGLYFGTKENPVKPTRSTIGVAALVNADVFIEVEMVAVYP